MGLSPFAGGWIGNDQLDDGSSCAGGSRFSSLAPKGVSGLHPIRMIVEESRG
jgi:hypothetical protein